MSLDQRDLVKCVRKYRNLDDELKQINTRVYKLREDKKMVETEMSDILRRTNFQTLNKLEIQDDGSYIKIQRPDTWNKPWNLGARELQTLVDGYFRTGGTHTAEACCKYIVENRRRDLVAKDFSFTRVLPLTDNDEDENNGVGEPARV